MNSRITEKKVAGLFKTNEFTEAYTNMVEEKTKLKVTTAVNSNVKGVVVGITPDKKTVIFSKDDYDNKGNVTGKYEELPRVGPYGTDAYYLASVNFKPDGLKKLKLTNDDVKKIDSILNKFKKDNISESKNKVYTEATVELASVSKDDKSNAIVGITTKGKVIAFHKKDFNGIDKLKGKYVELPSIGAKGVGAFYLDLVGYSPSMAKRMKVSPAEIKKIKNLIKSVDSDNVSESKKKMKFKVGDPVWYYDNDGNNIEATIVSYDKKKGKVWIYINRDKQEKMVDLDEIEKDY